MYVFSPRAPPNEKLKNFHNCTLFKWAYINQYKEPEAALWRAYDLHIALIGASDGISVGAVKIVIGLHKNRLKYAPHAPLWGARVAPTKRGTR